MTVTTPPARRDWHASSWGWLRSLVAAGGLVLLGLFLARAPLSWCALLVCGGVGLALLLRYPTLGLYALAISVPFGSLREFSLAGVTVGASEALVLITVAAWFAHMLALRRFRLVRSRVVWGVLCYLAVLLVSLLPATDLVPALKQLAKWVEFLFVYLLVAGEVGERAQHYLVAALLTAGILEGALGIYQFIFQVGPAGFVLFGRYMRAYGTFQQPNPFGGYLGLSLPLAYGVALTQGKRALRVWRERSPGPLLLWVLSLVATAVMSAALVMSWSRGALLGLAAGAALVLLALGRRVWVAVAVLALVLLLVAPAFMGVLPTDLLTRITGSFSIPDANALASVEITDENFATIERLAHWQAAWRMFEQHPWLGVGTGQYATAYAAVALPRWQDSLGHAHNYYLNVLAENGLLGLAGYAAFVLLALAAAWRAAHRGTPWQRALALGALGMLGHLLTHSLVDNLYVHEMYLLVAILLGLAVSKHPGEAIEKRARMARLQL